MCFGCSNTFGQGVSDSDAWPYLLSGLAQIPVINLGQPGVGWGFNWVNSVRIIQAGIRPRAVVYYWPHPGRMFTFPDPDDLNLVIAHGPWAIQNANPMTDRPDLKMGALWAQDLVLSTFWSKQYKISLDIMWGQLKIPVLHTTWDSKLMIENVEVIEFLNHSQNNLDLRSRDIIHPGVKDHEFIAQEIYSRLIASDPSL